MAWTGLTLTVEGRNALNQAQLNNKLNFKSIVVGDGMAPANFSTQKELVHQLYELTDLKIDITEDGCTLTADFPRLDYDYYFRELGIIVITEEGEKLYVYDNCGDDAQYIISSTGVERTEKRIRLSLIISDVESITISKPSLLYVAYDEYEKAISTLEKEKIDCDNGDISNSVVEFTEAEDIQNIQSGEKVKNIFGKIQKILSEFIAHLNDSVKHITSDERNLWDTVSNKVDKIEGKGLSTNDYTNVDKAKLNGVEEGANKYVHPTKHTADIITQDTTHRFVTDTEKETWNNSLNNAKDYADATYQQSTGYTDNKIAELINGAPETLDTLKEVADAIEENETVVEALDAAIGKKANQAELDTHTVNSVIHVTATDKSNWNAAKTHAASAHAPANAEVNQNAFSNVVVGSTTIAADSKTDTLTFAAGNNVTLTPDATNDKVTFAAKDTTYTLTKSGSTITLTGSDGSKTSVSDSNTTYATGTATASGITKLYTATGSATDGTMTQSAITNALNGKAASSHTHSYIPLSGSSAITGNLISSTNAQKNLGDRTHVWNEVWAKSVKVTGSYGEDETYGIAYTDNDDRSGLVIGNLDDTEGGSNSNWVVITDDCKMYNNLDVDGYIQGAGAINLMKRIYPVGSIYISVNSTNPNSLFGFGTWTQIKDTFLLAAGNTYTAGSTGGEATHKLTVNEIPAHTHSVSFTTTSGASNMTGAFAGSNGNSIGNTTATTTTSGGSAAHNNMPPYLAVYVWKRTA